MYNMANIKHYDETPRDLNLSPSRPSFRVWFIWKIGCGLEDDLSGLFRNIIY